MHLLPWGESFTHFLMNIVRSCKGSTSARNNCSHEYDCRTDPVSYFRAIAIGHWWLWHSKGPFSWVSLRADLWYRWTPCRKTHLRISKLPVGRAGEMVPAAHKPACRKRSWEWLLLSHCLGPVTTSVWTTLYRCVWLLACGMSVCRPVVTWIQRETGDNMNNQDETSRSIRKGAQEHLNRHPEDLLQVNELGPKSQSSDYLTSLCSLHQSQAQEARDLFKWHRRSEEYIKLFQNSKPGAEDADG